jgi:hypothetical protein
VATLSTSKQRRESTTPRAAQEITRIQEHLRGAEELLARRDLSALSSEARAARARRVAELHAYAAGGRFPKNRDFPAQRMPYFIDADGTRCAMAHLIECAGDSGLVARIARTRNNARVRELADDPELVAWLDRNGISLAEAARIQPQYGNFRNHDTSDETMGRAILGGLIGLEGVGVLLNARLADTRRGRQWRGFYGVTFGVVGTMSGVALLGDENSSVGWSTAVLVLGISSLALGARQLAHQNDVPPKAVSLSAVPYRSSDGAPGLALLARF